MGRIAKIVTTQELSQVVAKIAKDLDYYGEEPKIFAKDLGKIEFSMENIEFDDLGFGNEFSVNIIVDNKSENYNVTIVTLENGFSYGLIRAFGDWEHPVYFIIYIDNKNKLRGYVPTFGNTFNVKQKCAYGSEEDDETEDSWDGETEYKLNLEEFNKDILSRISLNN